MASLSLASFFSDPGWTLNNTPEWMNQRADLFTTPQNNNKKDDFTMRITKTKMLDGWLVQTYLIINGTEHMVAESQYVETDEGDPVANETKDVVARLRALLA